MALVACPDCHREISDLAPACQGCGRPAGGVAAGPTARRMEPALVVGILLAPIVFAWFTLGRGYSMAARAWSFAYLALCVLAGGLVWWILFGLVAPAAIGMQPLSEAMQTASTADQRPAIPVTARGLADAYQANELEADTRYKGRQVIVSGYVLKIGRASDGSPTVFLNSEKGADMGQVDALFDSYMTTNIATLHPGQAFKAQCTVAGLLGVVIVQGCALIEPAFTFNGQH